jgi:hypothetical protein
MKIPRTLAVSPQGRKQRGRLFDTLDNPFIMRGAIDYRSSTRHKMPDHTESRAGVAQEESQRQVQLAVACID